MFKQGHTISYWYSDQGNHAYMDDEGFVYRVTHNKYDNKPTKQRKTMKYFKTKILIMATIIFSLWFGILNANETKYYSAVPVSDQYTPKLIMGLDMEQKWTNIDSLENTIITAVTVSLKRAQQDYNYYRSIGHVIDTKFGTYNVHFIKEFQGFWIFEVLEMYDNNTQQDML